MYLLQCKPTVRTPQGEVNPGEERPQVGPVGKNRLAVESRLAVGRVGRVALAGRAVGRVGRAVGRAVVSPPTATTHSNCVGWILL